MVLTLKTVRAKKIQIALKDIMHANLVYNQKNKVPSLIFSFCHVSFLLSWDLFHDYLVYEATKGFFLVSFN